jgi:hypothetical protein
MQIRMFSSSLVVRHGQIQRLHLQLVNEIQNQKQINKIMELEKRIEKLEKSMLEVAKTKNVITCIKPINKALVIPDIYYEIDRDTSNN